MKQVEFQLLKVGHCKHPEFIARRGGRWKQIEFPALVGLIKHPDLGYILFDTGYSTHFFNATKSFPSNIYAKITPVTLPIEEKLIDQLKKQNILPEEIKTIILSHFHADHIAGSKNFPNARYISYQEDFNHLSRKSKIAQVRNGFLSELLPTDFSMRNHWLEDIPKVQLPQELSPFKFGYDLLGDRSLFGIDLPGHAASQLGIYFHTKKAKVFLIADASWSIEAIQQNQKPSRLAYSIFAHRKNYNATFDQLVNLHRTQPNIQLISSHCSTTWNEYLNEEK